MYTTYAVNAGQTKMQAMAFLEDGSKATGIGMVPGVDTAWAGGSSYSSRTLVSKGDALGIVLSSTGGNINQPVQELYNPSSFTGIDLVKTTTAYTVYVSQNKTISGTGSSLKVFSANNSKNSASYAQSCKEINDAGISQ
jgi:hypothetical protein